MDHRIAVIGLGYVGLPLAVGLAPHYTVTGFDINQTRIQELQKGIDRTKEVPADILSKSSLILTAAAEDLEKHDIFIVTVPTPVDHQNKPDLTLLKKASSLVGQFVRPGAIVVFESTVYPGVTEDVCAKVIEETSGLVSGRDFYLGYSPERINPGDKVHTLERITKVVAGQTPAVAEKLAQVYGKLNGDNIFVAANIKTAEASKVIENAQRDINIAFVNEIAMIFNKLGISTKDVLAASQTKWNFLPFEPGLVGGHCIGVDPFYLAECSKKLGHNPEVILAGRRINDSMGRFIAASIYEAAFEDRAYGQGARVLVMGLTFKENVPDLRNSKVIDMIRYFQDYGCHVDVFDPHADPQEAKAIYGIDLIAEVTEAEAGAKVDAKVVGHDISVSKRGGGYDIVVGAVNHTVFSQLSETELSNLVRPEGLLADVKGIWPRVTASKELKTWTL